MTDLPKEILDTIDDLIEIAHEVPLGGSNIPPNTTDLQACEALCKALLINIIKKHIFEEKIKELNTTFSKYSTQME